MSLPSDILEVRLSLEVRLQSHQVRLKPHLQGDNELSLPNTNSERLTLNA